MSPDERATKACTEALMLEVALMNIMNVSHDEIDANIARKQMYNVAKLVLENLKLFRSKHEK